MLTKLKKKYRIASIIFTCFIVIIILSSLRNHYIIKDISENREFTKGHVYSTKQKPKTTNQILVDYYYYVNNEKIEDNAIVSVAGEYYDIFTNKDFPVIYSKKNPTRNKILITPNDFGQFLLPLPDNQYWVLGYLIYRPSK